MSHARSPQPTFHRVTIGVGLAAGSGKPSIDKKNAALRPKLVPLNRVPRALAGAKQRLQLDPNPPLGIVRLRAIQSW
jgi:hypothetical protein